MCTCITLPNLDESLRICTAIQDSLQCLSNMESQVDRNSITDLTIAGAYAAAESPFIRERLDTCILPYVERTSVLRVTSFGLFLGRIASQRKRGLIHR